MADISPPSSAGSDPGSEDSFFQVKSDGSRSDLSDESVKQNDIVSDKAEADLAWRWRIIEVYVDDDNNNQLKRTAEFTLLECKGYHTLAVEIKAEGSQLDDRAKMLDLPHISWPWAPRYWKAEYYGRSDEGDRVRLDPLRMDWNTFSSRLMEVVMSQKATEEPEGPEKLIAMQILNDEIVVKNLKITRSVVEGNHKLLMRILYLYTCAYVGEEPKDKMPGDPWFPIAECDFFDDGSVLMDIPDSEDGNAREDEQPEVVDEARNEMEVHEDEDVEPEEWEVFLTRLAFVRYSLL